MSQKNNDIIYTSADIEKYHKGRLSAKEMHALEKAALDDPFLADALEGYIVKDVNAKADIADLKSRLAQRIEQDSKAIPVVSAKKISFSWWKVAAAIVVIAGAGLLVYQTSFNKKGNTVAHTHVTSKAVKSEAGDSAKKDSPGSSISDTNNSISSALTSEQSKPKLESAGTSHESSSSSNEAARVKADAIADDKNVETNAIPAPAAPAVLAEKKAEQALHDDIRQRRINPLKQEEVIAKNQNNQGVIVDQGNGFIKSEPGAAAQSRAKVQSKRNITHTNIFRGRVTDAQNNALPFSNITNTEDNIGTYSDAKGYFVLTSPDSVLNVMVSSVGFDTSKVQLQTNVLSNNIALQEDRSLAEVVIADKKINSSRSRDANRVLEEPEPADGWSNYDIYLANNLKTPEIFKDKVSDVKGEVELSFEVDKNGNPYNITVKKSLCESCDKEAIRLIKEGPKWKRKAKKGKATVKIAF